MFYKNLFKSISKSLEFFIFLLFVVCIWHIPIISFMSVLAITIGYLVGEFIALMWIVPFMDKLFKKETNEKTN